MEARNCSEEGLEADLPGLLLWRMAGHKATGRAVDLGVSYMFFEPGSRSTTSHQEKVVPG